MKKVSFLKHIAHFLKCVFLFSGKINMNTTNKPRTFLGTTALDEFWDKAQPILFLGEWCNPYKYNNKEVWKNCDFEIFNNANIAQDPDEVLIYINQVYTNLLPEIAKWLNNVHDTQHSLRYWEIIIGPFLFMHIQTIYHRYSKLKKVYLHYPGLKTIGLSNTSFLTPINFNEYYEWSQTDDLWNLQVFTQLISSNFNFSIVEYKNSPSRAKETKEKPELQGTVHYKRKRSKKIIRLLNSLLWFIVKLRGSKVVALPDFPFAKKILLHYMFSSAFTLLPILPRNSAEAESLALSQTAVNLSLRSNIINLLAPDLFSKIVLELLVVNMPLSFVENYKKLCCISDKQYPYFAKVIFGVFPTSGEPIRIWIAKNANRGVKQVGMQHGGAYAAVRHSSYLFLDCKFSDRYFLWGMENNKNMLAAPSINVCEMIDNHKKRILFRQDNKKILWVATQFHRYPADVKEAFSADLSEKIYHDWQSTILTLLKPCVIQDVTMRFRPTDFFDNYEYLKAHFPDLKLHKPKDKMSFYEHIVTAKLLLFDNFNTTHLYGLALNIPSILFWDEKIWAVKDEVKCYFDALHDAGIYHTTPESAAEMINKVADNPTLWWNSKEVQNARQQYCDYFTLASKDWVKKWRRLLMDLRYI